MFFNIFDMKNQSLKQLLYLVVGVGLDIRTFEEILSREDAMDGKIRVTLVLDNYNDLDLHLITPSGEKIYYGHRRSSDGGILDIDMNVNSHHSLEPVENIVFPNNIPQGHYKVIVNYYNYHKGEVETPFSVNVKIDDYSEIFEGTLSEEHQEKLIYEFDY